MPSMSRRHWRAGPCSASVAVTTVSLDGIDGVFALNHLSPLVLPENLLGSLGAGSRVVAVTSSSITTIPLAGEPFSSAFGCVGGSGAAKRVHGRVTVSQHEPRHLVGRHPHLL